MVTSLSTPLTACQPMPVAEKGKSMVTFGVIGYGYWGPNIVRNLDGVGRGHCVGHFRQVRCCSRAGAKSDPRSQADGRRERGNSGHQKSTRSRS